jgi:hypothetical protein
MGRGPGGSWCFPELELWERQVTDLMWLLAWQGLSGLLALNVVLTFIAGGVGAMVCDPPQEVLDVGMHGR